LNRIDHNISVLLVEDDEIDQEALTRHIAVQKLPYRLRCTTDVSVAGRALAEESFDVVLLDYDLKTGTGMDLLPLAGETPVIFVTGSGSEQIAVDAMRLGASDYLIKDPERNYLTVLPITIRNVLERKAAQRTLKENEEKLRITMSSFSDLVFELDTDGIFRGFFQDPLHPDLLKPPDQFLGNHYSDVLPTNAARKLDTAIAAAMTTGNARKIEYAVPFPEGTRWFEAVVSPRRDYQGTIAGLTIVARNNTLRKQAEKELQTANDLLEQRVRERTAELQDAYHKLKTGEARLNRFMEAATESFFLLDSRLIFLDVNKRGLELLGMEKDQVVGCDIRDIIPDISTSGRYERHREVLRSGEPYTVEDHVMQTNYGEVTGILKVFRVEDGLGVMFIDTSRRKKLESQLQQARKMEAVGSLAGGIAHDFNNILGVIVGYTELALEDIPGTTQAAENLEQVLHASGRARELVNRLLAFSRHEEHRKQAAFLRQITTDVLKRLKPTLPAGIRVSTDLDEAETLGPLLLDVSRIEQVIENIYANAVQSMQGGNGTLSLRLTEIEILPRPGGMDDMLPGRYQVLSFTDTGPGMKPDVLHRIFEPYFTTRVQGDGSGMGLAVVYGILKSHGGDIAVDSQPGKGTVFSIYLPVKKMQADAPIVDCECLGAEENKALHILLVEDKQPILELQENMLRQMGYKVTSRTSSVEALSLFKDHPHQFQLVICDQASANLDGMHLAVAMRRIRTGIKIILVTGFCEEITPTVLTATGIDGHIRKPLVKEELQSIIAAVLN